MISYDRTFFPSAKSRTDSLLFCNLIVLHLQLLNKALLYIRQNEDCAWVRIIHCHVSNAHLEEFQKIVHFLDEIYPKIKIDLICAQGAFSPAMVARLSEELKIPRVRCHPNS
jgi:hypothetical protein